MPKKEVLLEKLFRKQIPKNFTVHELDALMARCGCVKSQGGRGSAIAYTHVKTMRVVQFDQPHPGNELHAYQVRQVKKFLIETGEVKGESV